jgi:hypothetical protein
MSTKSLLKKDESDELARLLTVERLKAAGVTAQRRPGNRSPDVNLDALFEIARSTNDAPAKRKATKIDRDLVKKLAGV